MLAEVLVPEGVKDVLSRGGHIKVSVEDEAEAVRAEWQEGENRKFRE